MTESTACTFSYRLCLDAVAGLADLSSKSVKAARVLRLEHVDRNKKGSPPRLPLFVTVVAAYAPTGSATRTLTGVSQL